MNSRFKIRVWDKKSKCFVDDVNPLLLINKAGTTYSFGFDPDNDDYIIEQCTGQKNSNYELIYEGDVVILHYSTFNGVYEIEHKMRGLIKWEDFGFVVEDRYGAKCDLNTLFIDSTMDIKVIGNIHENPELMEE